MKKHFLIIIIGLLFFTTACSSWLEEDQFDKINSEIIYQSPEGLATAVNGLYSLNRRYYRFIDTNDTRANYWFYCADDLCITRTYNDNNIYQAGMIGGIDFYADMWVNGYQLIDRSSAVIVAARKMEMDAATKNKMLAEARAIRAMTYLRLVTVYDNILLDTIPTTSANAFDKVEYKPATKEQIFALINSDLDFAIPILPYSVSKEKIGQGMARMLRAQSAMWMNDYSAAATHCDDIIKNGGYSLVSIDQVFGATSLKHNETMMVLPFDELLGGADNRAGGSGSPLGGAFQSRFYEIKVSGQPNPIIEDNVYGGNAFGWNLPNDYLRTLYDVTKDKRMKFYYYPDTLIVNNPLSPAFGKPIPKALPYSTNIREYHWSIMKYRDFEKPAGTAMSYRDKILYRLAETLLLGAEAHWRIGGSTDMKALEYINKIRTRAGLPNVTTVDLKTIMDEDA
ncbi:MAG TPA: RagB/SusD family nutrient uptake outer membrane protein, partial [Prolixibacteraceae bacterium]|nr:RagB/SusD family nutrient uptake outer membrane protein [Prolixibacteraceae bacterium]